MHSQTVLYILLTHPALCVQVRLISGPANLLCFCVPSTTDGITVLNLARSVPPPEPHKEVAPKYVSKSPLSIFTPCSHSADHDSLCPS